MHRHVPNAGRSPQAQAQAPRSSTAAAAAGGGGGGGGVGAGASPSTGRRGGGEGRGGTYSSATAARDGTRPSYPARTGRDDEDYEMDLDFDDDEEEEEEDDDDDDDRIILGAVPMKESFARRQEREFVLSVLDCPEQLMMFAQSANDSIPGQRYHFLSKLCGFDEAAPPPKPPRSRRSGDS